MAGETEVPPEQKVEDLPQIIRCTVWSIEMVLVGDKDGRNLTQPCSYEAPVHGVTDNAINCKRVDQVPDCQHRSNHVNHDPFRAPECLFQAEKTILPFQADFPYRAVDVGTAMLGNEIV
jgi:hypothetical protein